MRRTALNLTALLGVLIALGIGGQRVASGETTETHLFLPLIRRPAPTLIFSQWVLDSGLDLFTIQADGAGKTRLTSSARDEWEAAWSPDGGRIAFSRWGSQPSADGNSDLRHHVFVASADGTGERQLVGLLSSQSPAWSPDGSRLALVGYRGTDSWGEPSDPYLYVVRADGTGLRSLAAISSCDSALQWSPDGRKIACSNKSSSTIFVTNSDGSEQRRLSSGLRMVRAGRFVWAPDSARIAYAGTSADGSNALAVLRVDGSPPTTVLSGREYLSEPGWSPDGSKLVFTSRVYSTSSFVDAVEVIGVDGAGRTRLIELANVRIEDPLWSPDGRQICFTALDMAQGPMEGIYVMGADGSAPLRLSDGSMPSWRPEGE